MLTSKTIIEIQQEQYIPQYEQRSDWWQALVEEYVDTIKISSKTYLLWNFTLFVTIYYSFLSNLFTIFIISLVSPSLASQVPFNQVSQYLNTCLPLIDIIFIRWRVERYDSEEAIVSLSQLFRNYMIYYFAIDLLVLIIMLCDIGQVEMGFWKLLIYSKILIFQTIKEEIVFAVKGIQLLELAFKTVRLLTFIIFWTFFFSCVFVSIQLQQINARTYNYENGFLWLTTHASLNYINLYENFEWEVWFEYALFFVLQMVRGAGMGIPSPRCPRSMMWYSFSNLTMTVIFWYFTDKVIFMIHKVLQKNQQVATFIALKQLRQNNTISDSELGQYNIFLQHTFSPSLQVVRTEQKLQNMVPNHLRREFNWRFKQHFIMRFRFLSHITRGSKLQTHFQKELSQLIHSKFLYQGEYIYRRNVMTEPRLYLSEKSHVIVENEEMVYRQKMPDWAFLGVREFFVDCKPLFNVIAGKVAAVQYIQKDQFMGVLRKYPRFYQTYRERIDGILIEKESTEDIELSCWYCSKIHEESEYHLNENCLMSRRKKRLSISSTSRANFKYMRNNTSLSFCTKRRPYNRRDLPHPKLWSIKRYCPPADSYFKRDSSSINYNIDNSIVFTSSHVRLSSEIIRISMFSIKKEESEDSQSNISI